MNTYRKEADSMLRDADEFHESMLNRLTNLLTEMAVHRVDLENLMIGDTRLNPVLAIFRESSTEGDDWYIKGREMGVQDLSYLTITEMAHMAGMVMDKYFPEQIIT